MTSHLSQSLCWRVNPSQQLRFIGYILVFFGVLARVSNGSDPTISETTFTPVNGWKASRHIATTYATQAAAADDSYIYAISSTTIAQINRETGALVTTATSPTTKHLNSGFIFNRKLFCAHSNYPNEPHKCDIRVFDPEDGSIRIYHAFKDPPGSLVWCIRRGGNWWCCFARYGNKNHKTYLVEYANGGLDNEKRRLLFPEKVVEDWDDMSASGGIWINDVLLTSHHHFPVLYKMRLPSQESSNNRLQLVSVFDCPFPGQGFALDFSRTDSPNQQKPPLVGISRPKRYVIFAEAHNETDKRSPADR